MRTSTAHDTVVAFRNRVGTPAPEGDGCPRSGRGIGLAEARVDRRAGQGPARRRDAAYGPANRRARLLPTATSAGLFPDQVMISTPGGIIVLMTLNTSLTGVHAPHRRQLTLTPDGGEPAPPGAPFARNDLARSGRRDGTALRAAARPEPGGEPRP